MAIGDNTIIIDAQQVADLPTILALHEKAFGSPAEAKLVEQLCEQTGFNPKLSRVARIDHQVVGHILFNELYTDSNMRLRVVALAPMAVLPEYQGKGVGGALIEEGFTFLEQRGYAGVVVLGDTAYYSRHGFMHKLVAHISSPYQCQHYMGYELLEGTFSHIHKIHYPAVFSDFATTEKVVKPIGVEEVDDLSSSEIPLAASIKNETIPSWSLQQRIYGIE